MESLQNCISWIEKSRPRNIAILTGAGISAESGIPTFRGPGGLWENYRAEDLATPEAFSRDPKLVWRWYEWRRGIVRDAQPNEAHRALARLASGLSSAGGRATLITQNVDGLHARAGSRDVLELHGNIFRARCPRGHTAEYPDAFAELPPSCSCGAMLRPDIVWFGEALPADVLAHASTAVMNCDLLLIIGTSGLVYPAAGLASLLRHGRAVEINPAASAIASSCDFVIGATAVTATPPVVDAILGGVA
ncbi:MAG: SIR2 family NAD-dependent protein deacylase [Thermoanaerobaculia bacterium]